MIELRSGATRRYWWRLLRRTTGLALGVHWPRATWNQWQVDLGPLVLQWGPA